MGMAARHWEPNFSSGGPGLRDWLSFRAVDCSRNVEPELQFRRTENCGLVVFSPVDRAYIAPDFGAAGVAETPAMR
jgi:hypothetical protein